MKRNLLVLAVILLIGFIVNSCGGEENECSICKNGQHCNTHCVNENCPVHDCKNHNKNECSICNPICNLGEHLGIGEICNGSNCSLQNYNTSTGVNAFPKPIYRVGPVTDFNASVLAKTVDDVMETYTENTMGFDGLDKINFEKNMSYVQIYKTGGYYTWKD
jgi:hypothetical protein